MEGAKKNGPDMEEEPEGGRQGRWRGLRRGGGGEMQFVVEDGGREGPGDVEEAQAQEAGGGELRPEEYPQVEPVRQGDRDMVGEGERAVVDGGQRSGSGESEREERQGSGGKAGDSGAGDSVRISGIWASQKLSTGSLLDLSKLQDPRTQGYLVIFGLYSTPIAYC